VQKDSFAVPIFGHVDRPGLAVPLPEHAQQGTDDGNLALVLGGATAVNLGSPRSPGAAVENAAVRGNGRPTLAGLSGTPGFGAAALGDMRQVQQVFYGVALGLRGSPP
jgi:hypothetical protein